MRISSLVPSIIRFRRCAFCCLALLAARAFPQDAPSAPAPAPSAAALPDGNAQQVDAAEVTEIPVYDASGSAQEAVITVTYFPALHEARFVYSCRGGIYDRSKPIPAIGAQVSVFARAHGYYDYFYYRNGSTRFDNAANTASYTAFVKFR